jgi:hypothetical protein
MVSVWRYDIRSSLMAARPVVVEHEGITVVRDDLEPGGSKRAVLDEILPAWDCSELVFPAASEGYGQLALALAGAKAHKRVTLFVAERKEPHPLTRLSIAAGAHVKWIPNGRYSTVQARARSYALAHEAKYLPPGFSDPDFAAGMAERARSLDLDPRVVVVSVGSGTLCRALQRAWPYARFLAISYGMKPDAGRAEVIETPEEHWQPAQDPPPFPSAIGQDAKAWRFVPRDPGVVFWNVAG